MDDIHPPFLSRPDPPLSSSRPTPSSPPIIIVVVVIVIIPRCRRLEVPPRTVRAVMLDEFRRRARVDLRHHLDARERRTDRRRRRPPVVVVVDVVVATSVDVVPRLLRGRRGHGRRPALSAISDAI